MATPMQDPPEADERADEPACCKGQCCGPGSYCCQHAGPHSHDDKSASASGEDVTAAELDEVERLDKAATPGPWWRGDTEEHDHGDGDTLYAEHAADGTPYWLAGPFAGETDARFCEVARTLLPRLARAHLALAAAKVQEGSDVGAQIVIGCLEHGQKKREAEIAALREEARDAHARGRREAIEEAAGLRDLARAVCELEWEGAWRLSDDDTLLFSALRAEVDR